MHKSTCSGPELAQYVEPLVMRSEHTSQCSWSHPSSTTTQSTGSNGWPRYGTHALPSAAAKLGYGQKVRCTKRQRLNVAQSSGEIRSRMSCACTVDRPLLHRTRSLTSGAALRPVWSSTWFGVLVYQPTSTAILHCCLDRLENQTPFFKVLNDCERTHI